MEARRARTARGWSVALLAGVLTAALHAAAGGALPAPAILILTVVLAAQLSTAAVGRANSLPRLIAAVAASQACFHVAFTLLGAGMATAVVHAPGHGAGHGALHFESAGTAHAAAGTGMIAAHALAGVLSAVLLSHGERALAGLIRLAVLAVARALGGAVTPSPVLNVRLAPVDAPPSGTGVTLFTAMRYRGPPAFVVN